MKINWTDEEAYVISSIKKHLAAPCRISVSDRYCDIVQAFAKYRDENITFAEKWELPPAIWQYKSYTNEKYVWQHELAQGLVFLIAGKFMPLTSDLSERAECFLFYHGFYGKNLHLPEPFPGHVLKASALAGNTAACKLNLDLAKNPEKKKQGVFGLMINHSEFQAAAELHTLCGGGLELLEPKTLLGIWNQANANKVCEELDRFIIHSILTKNDYEMSLFIQRQMGSLPKGSVPHKGSYW